MKNTDWDTAITAAPQDNWQDAETNESGIQNNESRNAEPNRYDTDEEEVSVYAAGRNDDPDPDDEEEEEEEETKEDEDDEAGDWGHVDPAEGNSPFPDSNAPGFPGSAV